MATTRLPDASRPVQQQYLAQLALTVALAQALRQLWEVAKPTESVDGMTRFRNGVYALVVQFSGAASSIAMDFYRTVRRDAGVTSALPPRVLRSVPPPPRSLVDAGLDWALRDAEREIEAVLNRIDAAMQKALTDVSREQVTAAVANDDKALGFRRQPRPGACAFCILMSIRSTTRQGLAKDFGRYAPGTMGAERHYGVYKSRLTAGLDADRLFEGDGAAKFHDWCNCVIEPVFSPVEALPEWLADMERLYDETEGGLREFRRAIRMLRRGEEPEPPATPTLSPPNPQTGQINALLDLLSQVA